MPAPSRKRCGTAARRRQAPAAPLVLAAYRAAGGAGIAELLAAAVEIVHAYSLVHDDLPCMDDDDRAAGTTDGASRVYECRRNHRRRGDGAVRGSCGTRKALVRSGCLWRYAAASFDELMRASGAGGMVGGQLLDLEGEGKPLTLRDLERIHRAKTGALIAARFDWRDGGRRHGPVRRRWIVTAAEWAWRSRSPTTCSM